MNSISSIKFYNTDQDKLIQVAISIIDKCHAKNEQFFVTSTATTNILQDLDKKIWTFASLKFIPHFFSQDNEFKIYQQHCQNLLSYTYDDAKLIQGENTTIIIFNYNQDAEITDQKQISSYIDENNLAMFNKQTSLTFVIISLTDAKTQINTSIEDCLKTLKSHQISHEIWQNFDFGWEKVF